MILGSAGLLGWTALAVRWSRLHRTEREVWLPYLSISLYALGNGLLTALARAGFGERAALSARYLNMVNLFWFCLVVLLVLWGGGRRKRGGWFVTVLVLGMTAGSLYGAASFPSVEARLEPARAELFRLQDDELLKRLFPDPERLRKWAAFLRSHRLSVYREGV